MSESAQSLMEGLGAGLAVGHAPAVTLSPQDETLFRAFQSNLLSLISHELRTPLMGVLNALMLLEDSLAGAPASADPITGEALRMARKNGTRLQHALTTLLDLAAIESGTFHVRLRETDLGRVVMHRVAAGRKQFSHSSLELAVIDSGDGGSASRGAPVLADPAQLGRAVDLCLALAAARAAERSRIELRISSASRLTLSFELASGKEGAWDAAWSQGVAGFEAGLSSPASVFSGVLQSERGFLSRDEEGLGSEFLLIHEIMRQHGGRFEARRQGARVEAELSLPVLSSEEGLRAVLVSRAFEVSSALGSVALVLIEVPKGLTARRLGELINESLFRTTDAAYPLEGRGGEGRGQVALVLDDCKPEDAPGLVKRLEKSLGEALRGQSLKHGIAQCPADGLDPTGLLPLAEARLKGI